MERKPTSNVTIRPYEDGDLERVRWLFARTPPWGRTYIRPQPLPDDLEDIPANFPGACWVACEDDIAGEQFVGEAIVGLIAARLVGADEAAALPSFITPAGKIAQVHWNSVAPERWRLGIAGMLMAECVAWARASGCTSIVLETTIWQEGAIAFYAAAGYEERGRVLDTLWKQVWCQQAL